MTRELPTDDEMRSFVLDTFMGLTPQEREVLADVFASVNWDAQRSRSLGDARLNQYPHRILEGGSPVTTDGSDALAALNTTSLFDTLNFVNGRVSINADNRRQADIQSGGGGADCEFDYIVSDCWATEVIKGRGTEGQVFTSLTGCTFKVYSTVAAMVTQAFTDFGSSSATALICPATYNETNITFGLQQTMIWRGGGRLNTIIGQTTATGTPTLNTTTGVTLVLKSLEIRGPSNEAGVEVGTGDEFGRLYADDCIFRGGSQTTDSATAGINGTSQSRTYLTNCHLIANGYYTALGFVHAVNCTHTGGGTGFRMLGDSQIVGCEFYSSAVGVRPILESVNISGNRFFGCTAGISVGGNMKNLNAVGNMFNACTVGVDLQGLGTSSGALANFIASNEFSETVTACIRMPVSTNIMAGGIIAQNSSDGAGAFITGTIPEHFRVGPNYEGSGYARTEEMVSSGLWGLTGTVLAADYSKVHWPAFVIYFGTTRVAVATGSLDYAAPLLAAGNYYVSVNTSGVVTANTTGAFPSNEFPMAVVTINAAGDVTAIVHHDTVFRMSTGGAPPAPNDAQFLTLATSTGLSAERVFTPRYNLYATDAGAKGAYTVDSWREGALITAVAGVLTLGTDGDVFHVGPSDVSSIATPTRQTLVVLVNDGASAYTHSANLILVNAANYTAAAGDVSIFLWEGGTVWREISRYLATDPVSPITVSEEDGTPVDSAVTVIRVPNDGLTDDGVGAVTLQYVHRTLLDALGDTIYASANDTPAKLAGNITTTKKFLRQTGTGAVSAAPAWDTIVAADIPVKIAQQFVFVPQAAALVAETLQPNRLCVGESGEHGTYAAIRAKATAGTAGTGTNTILIEADDNPAFSSAVTLFTLALDTATEVDDTVLDTAWASGDIFIRARCTAVGATAPQNVVVEFYFSQVVY